MDDTVGHLDGGVVVRLDYFIGHLHGVVEHLSFRDHTDHVVAGIWNVRLEFCP